jgi:Cdc6-like AAA superfamily ATPase
VHTESVSSDLDDPLHDWRVRGASLSTVADTVLTTEPPLVGREDLLVQFERLAARARNGAQVILALSGEPGSGKTRLLREFARRAEEKGLDVSWPTASATWFASGTRKRPQVIVCDGASSASQVLSRAEPGRRASNSGF